MALQHSGDSALLPNQVSILRSRIIVTVHAVSGRAICERGRGCTSRSCVDEDVMAGGARDRLVSGARIDGPAEAAV